MITATEVLKIIEQGLNTNAPSDTIVNAIKKYCESVINSTMNDLEQENEKNSNREK